MLCNFKHVDFRCYKTGVDLEILLLIESIFNLMYVTMFLGRIGEADIPLFGKNNLNCEKTGL